MSVARSMRVPAGEVRNTSRCEALAWLTDSVAVTASTRAPSPETSTVELAPVALLSGMASPSPSKSTATAAGGSDDAVVRVTDQLRSMPFEPPWSSITTSTHGPVAGSPTSAASAPSGWIGPVAIRFV